MPRPRISVNADRSWSCSGCSRTFPRSVRAPKRGGCRECRGHRVLIVRLGEGFRPRCSCGWSGDQWPAYSPARDERKVHEWIAMTNLCECGRPELYAPHPNPCDLPKVGRGPQEQMDVEEGPH